MTYGWAILIVIIVAAALFALGVFNPATYTSSAATGFAGLGTPREWAYSGTAFTIVLNNQVGQAITVSNVTAAQGCYDDTSTPISAGSTATFTLNCTSKAIGDSYSEAITVTYRVSGGTLDKAATGTLTGTAV